MEMDKTALATEVRLSKRNLLALLDKVDDPGSLTTLVRRTKAGLLIVKAEPDAEHYGDREPGPMSERSEAAIQQEVA
jgi:hypothetical protein